MSDESISNALLAVGTAVFLIILFSGCGHNTLTYMSGESSKVGITMSEQGYPIAGYSSFNGEALVYAMKDNTLVNVSMSDAGSTDVNKTGIGVKPNKIKGMMIYTGSQTTGYDVDLAEAIAKYDVEKAKKVAEKKNVAVIDAKVKDGKLEVNEVKLPLNEEVK